MQYGVKTYNIFIKSYNNCHIEGVAWLFFEMARGDMKLLKVVRAYYGVIFLLGACSGSDGKVKVVEVEKEVVVVQQVTQVEKVEVPVIVPVASGLADNIQVTTRPYFLIEGLDDGELKSRLKACSEGPFYKTDFSIAHRGAPLQYPEHTKESYEAAVRMGAGIVECDVTFTQDKELVCRHSQCDLHTTTNILATDLAAKCTTPFIPANIESQTPAQAKCCTSDITLAEFKSLKGKMDAAEPMATSVAQYLKGTADWRTDLYASEGTLLTHAQSIQLFNALGVKMTPELKSPNVSMPFDGFTQADYAQKMLDEYKAANIAPSHVWPQSFSLDDVTYWLDNEPEFAKQAVYLDGRYDDPAFDVTREQTWQPSMQALSDAGVKIIAPPLWMLVTEGADKNIIPSEYAIAAKEAGLDMIAWTLERSGPLASGGDWYYQTITNVTSQDSDQLKLLHVLAEDVGVIGVFSDWPGTTTYYASCMGFSASI